MQFKETLIAAILIIAVLFALLIFGNKLPQEMDSWTPILIIICFVLLGLIVIFYIIQKILAVKSAMAIEKKLKAQASEQISGARDDRKPELQALESQLNDALAALKTSKMGKGALYSMPWYMIIGPPGSGKTTALLESGLNFPYTSGGGRGIKGVGGTRNCDWWFTDQGILLDTAGRYTTELEDRDEWIGFLNMLKKCRKEKPINGVIVAISISDLINATDEEMEAHSKNIRDRVDELSKQLEMVFPVYLIFTKCDLLNGFTDFFEDFTKEDREQMWGMTLPYKQQGDTNFGDLFNEECKKFYETLRYQRMNALSMDRKSDKKRNIYSFPLQFALAHKKLGEFVGMLFRTNPFQESPILRGIFMTSGTQEGFPIDQVVGAMSEAFGLGAESGGLMGGEGEKKSYFINNLFTKLIFPDQKLAQISSKVARRKKFVRWGLGLGSVAALGLFSFLLVLSFIGNSALLYSTASAGEEVKESKDKDLKTRLSSLYELQGHLETLEENEENGPPFRNRFGLYRGNSILEEARDLYNQQLGSLFLERLQKLIRSELEERLNTGQTSGPKHISQYFDQLYKLNYTYQRLGGKVLDADPAENSLVNTVLSQPEYNFLNKMKKPGETKQSLWLEALNSSTPLSASEKSHANDLRSFYIEHLSDSRFKYEPALVEKVNQKLSDNFWVTEVYQEIRRNMLAQQNPLPISYKILCAPNERFITPKIDPGENPLLGQVPGEVPGMFTQTGSALMVGKISSSTDTLLTRMKLMGYEKKTRQEIVDQLTKEYVTDAELYWNAFLKSICISPFRSIDEARNFLVVVTSTDQSPIFLMFERAWNQRVLTINGKKYNEAKIGADINPDIVSSWWKSTNAAYGSTKKWIGSFKDSYGGSFQKLIDAGDGPISEMVEAFSSANGVLEDTEVLVREPLKTIVKDVLRQPIIETRSLLTRMAKDEMNSLWDKLVYTPFNSKMKQKYPFTRNRSNEDVTQQQFANLFANDKAGFFTVAGYVETLDKISLIDQDLLAITPSFSNAKEKADLFKALYPADNDGKSPLSVSFRLKFENANVSASNFTCGKTHENGMVSLPFHKLFTWKQGDALKLNAVPAGENAPKDFYPIVAQGDRGNSPWALFRLIDSTGTGFTPLNDKVILEWQLKPSDKAGDKLVIVLKPERETEILKKEFFEFTCPEILVD